MKNNNYTINKKKKVKYNKIIYSPNKMIKQIPINKNMQIL